MLNGYIPFDLRPVTLPGRSGTNVTPLPENPSSSGLKAENLALHQRLIVLRRSVKRPQIRK